MPFTQADAVAIKREQQAAWDAMSVGWVDAREAFEVGAATVTDRLLVLGGVRPGHAVLDVATGFGEPALTVAGVVGPTGTVVGADISPAMLEVATRRAADCPTVSFVVADVESIDLPPRSFDVALSRFGLMFAVDHRAAFRTMARLIAPGGVLAAAVWATPDRVPMLSLGFGVLSAGVRGDAGPPPVLPDAPGPFAMADPERLIADLAASGFTDLSIEEVEVPFRLADARGYADFTRQVSPPGLLREVYEKLGPEPDSEIWSAVEAAAERYQGDDGSCLLASTALLFRAVVDE